MRVVIYARFSSDKQTTASIEAQIRACREYAASRGWHVADADIFADEAISGKGESTQNRKSYQKLLREIDRRTVDIVLVHKYDRIARNMGEHVNLEKRLMDNGAKLIAAAQDFGDGKESKIVKALLWSLSEYYIDNLSDEVKKGHREVALEGMHNGGYPPFGFDVVDQRYVINEKEAVYVKKMFDCALNQVGYTRLIDEMEANGIVGKRGRPIRASQIYEILKNEKYTGTYCYSPKEETRRSDRRIKQNAIKIEKALPTIIDRDTYERVQKIMETKKNRSARREYLCSGLVYCGECGAKMHAATSQKKGYVYSRYICSKKCGAPTIREEEVNRVVSQYLKELLSEKTKEQVDAAIRLHLKGEKERTRTHNEWVKAEAAKRQKEIENYVNAIGSSALSVDVLADLNNKIVRLKKEIAELKEEPMPRSFTPQQVHAWLDSLAASTDERKTVLLLVERIDIKKTAVSVISTLTAVAECAGCAAAFYTGCGGRI